MDGRAWRMWQGSQRLEESFGNWPGPCFEGYDIAKADAVMTISLVPVGVADPPASLGAATARSGGQSFGQFIDNADAYAGGNAAPGPAPSSSPQAPAAGDQPSSTAAGKSTSASGVASEAGGRQGKRATAAGGQSTGDSASQRADGTVVSTPALPMQLIPPIANGPTPTNSIPTSTDKGHPRGVQSVTADADASGLSSLVGSPSKGQAAWQLAVSAANAKSDPAAAPASASALPAGNSQSDIQGIAKSAAAITADAALLAAPPVAATATPSGTTASGSARPVGGTVRTLSAQAAAALGHVSIVGATQPQAQPAAAAPPTGPAGAQLLGSTANSVIGATVTSPATSGAPSNDGGPVQAADGATAAPDKLLPSVSGAVDLTAKFSATALPAHGDVAAPAAKTKTDSHVAASAANAIDSRPTAPPAAEGATAGAAAKPAEASLADAPAGEPDVPSTDDAPAGSTTAPASIVAQPRGDVVAIQNGAPAMTPAQETAFAPVAALHSVADQVAVSLKRGAKAGNDQIQINLEPASLGKIAVRLEFAQDGRVTATFSADRRDTLALLNNDSRALEQSLRDAGLRADSGSLTFNLSGGDTGSNARQFAQSATYAATAATMADSDPLAPLVTAPAMSAGGGHDGRLDIHV
jgi:flagellar hook-length control protein FliK